jgi:hypothetical protein
MEWFSDIDHLHRFGAWLEGAAGRSAAQEMEAVVDNAATSVVVADELVVRGGDWLERRWQQGGDKLKHMAVALRAAGLTHEEFSDRWKNRAGRIRQSEGVELVIPDEARGRAYVQNHPRAGRDWAYDAINEVYFEDLDALRLRVDWFDQNLGNDAEEDLVRQSQFMAVREAVFLGQP